MRACSLERGDFGPRDFAPLSRVGISPGGLIVHPSLPVRNVKDLIALARAHPGKLSYSHSGIGSANHMAGELFKSMSGTDILHVPHKSSGEARNDVMGGHVQMMFDAVTAMKGNVEAGEVRALATTGLERSAVMPAVPTVNEAGVPGYEATIWLGIMAPKGLPRPIVEKLNAEITRIVASPKIKEAWAKQGAVPMSMTPEAFGDYIRKDIAKWADVIKKSGMTIQ